jgi:hypothetical protein
MREQSTYDKRDFTLGLAGFLAGIHALRILAEKGIASSADMAVSLEGVRSALAAMPAGMIGDAQLASIETTLNGIYEAAVAAEGAARG